MFAIDLSYFCTTISISVLTTIITFSSFTYIKNLYNEVQPDIKVMIHSETQTEFSDNDSDNSYININCDSCNSYIAIEYITIPVIEDSLEKLILLAKDQLVILHSPSNYKWNLCE